MSSAKQLALPREDQCVRILIADADAMTSQLLASALRRCRNHFSVAIANNSGEVLRKAIAQRPDVVVLSIELQDGARAGFGVLQKLRTAHPPAAIVMLLPSPERESILSAFRFGARGVICRAESFKALSKCIRSVHKGQIWASNRDMEYILEVLTRLKPIQLESFTGMALLTKREQDVTRLVAEGLKNGEIGARLHISEHTVSNYLYRIFDKMGISTRVELIMYALSHQRMAPHPSTGPDRFKSAV